MTSFSPVCQPAAESLWHYRHSDEREGLVECGVWSGRGSPGLRAHFHDEAQIVFVLSGSRIFLIDQLVIRVRAGQAAYIPPGLIHASRPTQEQTICVNLYLESSAPAPSLTLFDLGRRETKAVDRTGFPHCLQEGKGDQMRLAGYLADSYGPIAELAAGLGRSREGFSRLVKREMGIAPHAYRLLTRLNLARRMLREGQPIAGVAAEAGFADQSHLTRLFRSTFGTTPGLYRRR